MVEQLMEIIAARTLRAPDFSHLGDRFGAWSVGTPAQQLDFAIALCALAVPCLHEGGDSTPGDGADALLCFIANMPAWLVQGVAEVPEFRDDIMRAWEEPWADLYVSICNTVHDVWAHLLGPESAEDAQVMLAVDSWKAHRILDYGAGAGHFSLSLAAQGCQVDAFDVDIVKCAFLRYRVERQGLASQVRVGVIEGPYDVALAINVLDHLLDPAAAVELIAESTRAGGACVILAAFPSDGWHQADPEVVVRCASAVQRHFQPSLSSCPSLPWLEVYQRRGANPAVGLGPGTYPCLHPKSVLREETGEGQVVLSAEACFTQDCALDLPTAALCRQMTGAATIREIAGDLEIDVPDLIDFCRFLHQSGHVFWLDTDLHEPDRHSLTGEDHGRRLA